MIEFINILLWVLAIIAAGILLRLWWKAFQPKWYKPHFGIRLGNLDWCDVANCMKKNPLLFKDEHKSCRWPKLGDGFLLGLVYFLFILVICFLPIYFLCPINQFSLFTDGARTSNDQLPLFASGAPVPVVATLILGGAGIFYNMRLQARAQNRQNWINDMRQIIVNLLEILACYGANQKEREKKEKKEIEARYKKNMFQLELSINPSEKECRALLALIRRGSIFKKHQKWGGLIKRIDDCVLCHLGEQGENNICQNIDHCVGPNESNGRCECESCKERYKNISYIIRLSNVVLKREWEQVKYVR